MGLAPTTSTTMMLALGDAMAVALLRRRGFSPSDFQLLHPGGTLGHRLKRVRQIMHVADRLPLVAPDAPMSEAIVVMSACSFGCVGVVGPAGSPRSEGRRVGKEWCRAGGTGGEPEQ